MKKTFMIIGGLLVVAAIALAIVQLARDDETAPGEAGQIQENPGQYLDYSASAFNDNSGKQRWLFFYANWCPQCRSLDSDIEKNKQTIPQEVVIFKVDFDNSQDLKDKYGVTQQTKVVSVDANGDLIKKHNAHTNPRLAPAIKELYIEPAAEKDAAGETDSNTETEGPAEDSSSQNPVSSQTVTDSSADTPGDQGNTQENVQDSNKPETSQSSRYLEYSPASFSQHAGSNRWLYFHADWCPQCITLEANIRANLDRIPDDVVIFEVDFDRSTSLKSKYGVTQQTTIVSVDQNGERIKSHSAYRTPTLQNLIDNLR